MDITTEGDSSSNETIAEDISALGSYLDSQKRADPSGLNLPAWESSASQPADKRIDVAVRWRREIEQVRTCVDELLGLIASSADARARARGTEPDFDAHVDVSAKSIDALGRLSLSESLKASLRACVKSLEAELQAGSHSRLQGYHVDRRIAIMGFPDGKEHLPELPFASETGETGAAFRQWWQASGDFMRETGRLLQELHSEWSDDMLHAPAAFVVEELYRRTARGIRGESKKRVRQIASEAGEERGPDFLLPCSLAGILRYRAERVGSDVLGREPGVDISNGLFGDDELKAGASCTDDFVQTQNKELGPVPAPTDPVGRRDWLTAAEKLWRERLMESLTHPRVYAGDDDSVSRQSGSDDEDMDGAGGDDSADDADSISESGSADEIASEYETDSDVAMGM